MRSVLKAIGELSIVALTVTAIPESFAQTNLPDQTVCRRAINSERSGWVEGFYAEEASRRGLTFRACDEMTATSNSPAKESMPDDGYHPSFLQAGIFFMTGLEPPDIKFLAPDSAVEKDHQIVHNGMYTTVPVSYQLHDDKPCTIFGYILAPPYGAIRYEFGNLPSPRAASSTYVRGPQGQVDLVASMAIPHETVCKAQTKPTRDDAGRPTATLIPNTSMCDDKIVFSLNTIRRMKALDYIRANFCAGQPEPPPPPPPPPPKPY